MDKNIKLLNYKNIYPRLIKILNSLIFVESRRVKSLCIYDIYSFGLKQKIDKPTEYCRLSLINSILYRLNSQSKSVFLYDKNGNFKEEIILNNVDGQMISSEFDGSFIDFNGSLLMTSYSVKKLIKFSKI